MAKAVAGHLVVLDLGDQAGLQRLPLAAALGRPAARPTGGVAAGSRAALPTLEFGDQRRALVVAEARGEADMVELALGIEQAEQQRTHLPLLVAGIAEAADHTVGGAPAFHLDHGALAGAI